MVAPCVLMSYFKQFNEFESEAAPIDVTKFIRRVFDDNELYKYLVKDDGGDSPSILKTLITPFVKETRKADLRTFNGADVKDKNFDLEKRLAEMGPALVTGFKVHKRFHSKDENTEKLGYYQFFGRHHSEGKFIEVSRPATPNEGVERTLEEYIRGIVPVEKDRQNESVKVQESLSTPCALFQGTACDTIAPGGLYFEHRDLEKSVSIEDDEDCDTSKSYDKKETKKDKEETHAMILIGTRLDERKNRWLLLQNWWSDMELVEVSAEYFFNSHAELVFVNASGGWLDYNKLTNPHRNDLYDVSFSLVADTNNLDRCDQRNGCFEIVVRDRSGHRQSTL